MANERGVGNEHETPEEVHRLRVSTKPLALKERDLGGLKLIPAPGFGFDIVHVVPMIE